MNANLLCAQCLAVVQPRPKGHNAKYCSSKCKGAAKRERESKGLADPGKRERNTAYVRGRLANDPAFRMAHRVSTASYRKETREWLAQYKLSIGCVDCGFKGHFAALQLDHEGPKSVEISNARSSIARLKAEIESGQCKVRCANCHSIRTWERKQPAADDKGAVGPGCGE